MGWFGGHHRHFDFAQVPSPRLRLSCPVAVELICLDDGGFGGIYPSSRLCLPVACPIYCSGTHDSPGTGVANVDYTLGEAVEEGTLVQAREGAVRFLQLLAVATVGTILVLPELDC